MTARPPAERWAHLDHAALLAMRHKLLDRIQANSEVVSDGTHHWARYDQNVDATRSGTATSGEARRAKGRQTLDDRQLAELDDYLWERFDDSEEQLADWYLQHCDALEREALSDAEAAAESDAAWDPASIDSTALPVDAEPVRVAMPLPTAKVHKRQGPPCGCRGEALAFMHRVCPTCRIDACLYWTAESGTTAKCAKGHPLFPGIYREAVTA